MDIIWLSNVVPLYKLHFDRVFERLHFDLSILYIIWDQMESKSGWCCKTS